MNPPLSARLFSLRNWLVALSIALPLLVLVRQGQDANWDLRNYHLYNPHAWLHGRLAIDIAPAQLQSWHNPLLDLPLYLMAQAGWPGLVVSLWLTLPFIVSLYCLLRIQQRMTGSSAAWTGAFALAVIAITGAAAYPSLGTTLNDGFVAAVAMASLLLLMRRDAPKPSDWLWAGLLAGAMAGLKLTAAIYCLGLAGAALVACRWQDAPKRLAMLMLGGIAGFILTYGYWGWTMQQMHGNPMFPYFNQVFHSPGALPLAHADARFRPQALVDALLTPFRLLQVSHRYSELDLRDPRLLTGIVCFPLLLWLGRYWPGHKEKLRMLAAFFFVSLVVWLYLYGIYRYALPIEMLAALPLVLLLQRLPQPWASIALIVAAFAFVKVTVRPDWNHTRFTTPMVQVDMPALPRGSMLVVSSQEPIAYALLAVADDVPVVSIYNNFMVPERCTGLQAQAERRIASHKGPLWLLRTPSEADDVGETIARQYGLSTSADCRPVPTSLGELRLCPLQHQQVPIVCRFPAPAPGR